MVSNSNKRFPSKSSHFLVSGASLIAGVGHVSTVLSALPAKEETHTLENMGYKCAAPYPL